MTPSLTLFFVVEPPSYQYLACYLAASIREHLDPEIALVGYCPAHRMEELDPAVIETLRRMRCDVRPMQTEGVFDPVYPHGNKITACLEPRDTEWGGFMDSDILVMRAHDATRLLRPGHVTCSPAASIQWAPDDLWDIVYSTFDMPVPEDRITLMRDRRRPMVPYYSSGFVLFPEDSGFSETWMDTAQSLDRVGKLAPFRRPYLDQISLPVAIRRSGLAWNELEENDHFILGGKLRGKAFPRHRAITAVHYRKWEVLEEAGLAGQGYNTLQAQVGVKRVRRIFDAPLPAGIAPVDQIAAPAVQDPSKALIGAVTHARHEGFFLSKWIAHYGALIGRENLHVVLDGDDWAPEVDLTGIKVEVITGAPRERLTNDKFMATEMSQRANRLRARYRHVLRMDVDEFVALDPSLEQDWERALVTTEESGYVFAVGIDMVQTAGDSTPLDRDLPVLGQRRHGFVSQAYSKPVAISRWSQWSPGGHRLIGRTVRMDPQFLLFHLALADEGIVVERHRARGGDGQHPSFVQHATARASAIGDGRAADMLDYDAALAIALAEFQIEPDGSPAICPRRASHPSATNRGIPIRIPERFHGLV